MSAPRAEPRAPAGEGSGGGECGGAAGEGDGEGGPDRAYYLAGQALAAALADPRRDAAASAGGAGAVGAGWGALWGGGAGAGGVPGAAAASDAAWSAEAPPPRDPARLPDVGARDLARYLGSVGPSWDGYRRTRERMEARRRSAGTAGAPTPARGDSLVECMRKVPEVFFREDFALSEPRTFEAVCPGGGAASAPQGAAAGGGGPGVGGGHGGEACRAAALGALSQYVDAAEVHLLEEVQLRSEALLGAAGDLHALQGMLERARAKARAARVLVRSTDADILQTSRTVQSGLRRRKNLARLQSVLEAVQQVEAARAALLPMQEAGSFSEVLETVGFIRTATGGRDDLGALNCLQGVPREAARAVVGAIGQMRGRLEEAFGAAGPNPTLQVLGQLVREQPDLGGDLAAVARLWDLVLDAYQDDGCVASADLRRQLAAPAAGLLECMELLPSLEFCQGKVATAVKASFREAVDEMLVILIESKAEPRGASPGASGSSAPASLEAVLASLSMGEFSVIQATALAAVLGQLHHARQVTHELAACVDRGQSARAPGGGVLPASAPPADTVPTEDLSEACAAVLQQGAEAATRRWVKLLHARTEAHACLTLSEFSPVVRSSRIFAERLEGLGVRVPASVRATVTAQGKALLDNLHKKIRTQVEAVLDAEVWEPLASPPELQAVADSIYPGEAPTAKEGGGCDKEGKAGESHAFLRIGSHRVLAVSSVLALVQVIGQYLLFVEAVPELASDTAHRTLDTLRLFNSRSCELVLGGKAVEVAGLRVVSLSHLGHAHQAVQAMELLIPGVVARFQALLPPLHQQIILPQYKKFSSDLEKHREGVQGRMVDRMSERLKANMAALVGLSETWGQFQESPGSCSGSFQPSQFARTVIKQVGGFEDVLAAVLREDERQAVFCGLVRAFCDPLVECVVGLPSGADRLLWQRQMNADLGAVVSHLQTVTRGVQLQSLHRVEDLIVGEETLARLERMRAPAAMGENDGIAALRRQYAPETPTEEALPAPSLDTEGLARDSCGDRDGGGAGAVATAAPPESAATGPISPKK